MFHGVADAIVLPLFSDADEVPDRFRGVDQAEWVAILDHATEVGLLTAIGAGMYEIHPALPTFLAALWRTENSDNHATERSRATDALLTAYGEFCMWLREQIETGDASLAFAVLDRQRRTLGHLLGHALATHQWSTAQALIEPLNGYWDTRGLFPEADSWVDCIRAAVEAPAGAPPPLGEPAGSLWLYAVGAEANRASDAGDLDRSMQTYTQVLELLELQPTVAIQQRNVAATAHQLGCIAQERAHFGDAERWCRRSLAINEGLGNRSGVALTYHQLGRIAELRGDLGQAESWYRKSLAINEGLGDRPGMALTYHQLGILAELRGDLGQAESWYRKSLAIKEGLGDHPGMAASYHQLGRIAELRGDLGQAESWYHKSLTIKEGLGNHPGMASTYHQLGMIAQRRGDLGQAESWYHKSLSIEEGLGNLRGQARCYHQLGTIAQDRDNLDGAENWYHKSVTINEALGSRSSLAMAYGQLGLLAEKRGEPRGALSWTARCVALFEEFPHPLTEPGPEHLARLTGVLGTGVLEEVWREVTGVVLPENVRRYVERDLGRAGHDE